MYIYYFEFAIKYTHICNEYNEIDILIVNDYRL